MQITNQILMRRPRNFFRNEEAVESNSFYEELFDVSDLTKKVHQEFDTFVALLREVGVEVFVVEDEREDIPDSIFPNNWFSTHANGDLFIYPMELEGRRNEKCLDIFSDFEVETLKDLSFYEKEGRFLESTGSMIFDRVNKIIYAAISSRTDESLLEEFAKIIGYDFLPFHSYDRGGTLVYHSNIMMSLGVGFAVLCLESIKDNEERMFLEKSLMDTDHEIIEISLSQMHEFAGNVLQLVVGDGSTVLVLSQRAFKSLREDQIEKLKSYTKLLVVPINLIEKFGAGVVCVA